MTFLPNSSFRLAINGFAAFLMVFIIGSPLVASEQEMLVNVERLENGLSQLTSKHLRLWTDLPVSPEIMDLCKMFDLAMPQWGDAFQIPREKWENGRANACLIVDRQRFTDLKYITPEVPNFREGYQLQDRLFMLEQPSAYYRRHLLLHEGTHWFLWRFVGGNGPPWFSEGMCEMMSTHSWSAEGPTLRLNWIPPDRESVPYWGRLKLLRQTMAADKAPSLEKIMQYSDTAHRTDEPYAWSWAAVIFFTRNARYRDDLTQVFLPNLQSHIGSEHQLSRDFRNQLGDRWTDLQAEWTTFLSDLDYGYSPSYSIPKIELKLQSILDQSERKVSVLADRGWQTTGVSVLKGDRISTTASGRVVVRREKSSSLGAISQPWESEPQGVTLEYHQGYPLGSLLAVIVPDGAHESDPAYTARLNPFSIGKQADWTADRSGVLLMKLNEPSSGLFDNSGVYQVTIARQNTKARQ